MSTPSCTHDVLLHGSDDELVAGTAQFVRAGLAAGDVVVVNGPAAGPLHDAVGDDPRVRYAGAPASVAAAIADYQRACEREGPAGRRVRVTGPVPFGTDPAVRAEWMRYEALIGRALGPYRFSGLCSYDTRTTTAPLLELALAVHDRVVTGEGSRPNAHRRPRADVLRELAPSAGTDPLEAAPTVLADADCGAAAPVREAVHGALLGSGVAGGRAGAFVGAVNEVVTNALQHGRAPVGVRLHTDGQRWLCVVTDAGPGPVDPYAGFDSPLPGARAGGTGLWAARQLCERLSITRTPAGTTVRLHLTAARPGRTAAPLLRR